MPAVLDFGSFTQSEKTTLLAAAKAEMLRRAGLGSVNNGSSAAQNFGMMKMSEDGLITMINALSIELGYPQPETRVQPNFSGRPFYYGAPVCTTSQSRIEPNVTSWADLTALSTTGMPYNTIKIWVDASTGITMTARLLESTAETDESAGIYRPDDYANPGNTKVWFQAAN